jgi:late competence protein required for DNA uptake (superfamily II DNA/RNA helicase)
MIRWKYIGMAAMIHCRECGRIANFRYSSMDIVAYYCSECARHMPGWHLPELVSQEAIDHDIEQIMWLDLLQTDWR